MGGTCVIIDALQSRVPFAEAAQKLLSKLFTLFHLLDTASLDCRKAKSSVKVCEPSALLKLLEEENETLLNPESIEG